MPASPTDPDSLLGVVVVNYAAADLIRRTLAPVRLDAAVVVVVDNLSTAEERERAAALCREYGWEFVPMPDNRGFGPGVNAGAARARERGAGPLLLLNPDAEVTAELVAELHREVTERPLSLVSPLLVDGAGAVTFSGSLLDLADGRVRGERRAEQPPLPRRPVRWLTAACLAVGEQAWAAGGGFDEDYFMYWEDVDFSVRCAAAGAELRLREDLRVLHDQGGTQGPRVGRAKSALYYYFNARNRMLFATRHLDRAGIWAWCWRTPQVSWEILLRGGRRQLLERPGRAWSALRGAAAGMALGLRAVLQPRRRGATAVGSGVSAG